MGGLGGGFESGDPNLHDKIAKLKAKRGAQSGKQRVEEFLEKELHVDPRDLPFSLDAANSRMHEIMNGNGAGLADVVGNSLGLKAVAFKNANPSNPINGCPGCGSTTAGGHWADTRPEKGDGDWLCYDCDTTHAAPLPDMTLKTVTENDHGGEDWHDLHRCWAAYRKHATVKPAEEPAVEPASTSTEEHYTFTVTNEYRTASTYAVETPDPDPDATHYPSGATLRIQRATFNSGDMDVERIYVRIGGLFDDTTPTNIDTMRPITDMTGWTVIEQL